MGGPAPYSIFAPAMAEYRQACSEHGTRPVVSYVQPMHIAETENEAVRLARQALPYFYQQVAKPILAIDQKADAERLIGAGYAFYASDAMYQLLKLGYDDAVGQGMVWVGTPDQIRNRVIDFLDREKLDEFAIQVLARAPEVGFGFTDQQRTQELFATQVIPALR